MTNLPPEDQPGEQPGEQPGTAPEPGQQPAPGYQQEQQVPAQYPIGGAYPAAPQQPAAYGTPAYGAAPGPITAKPTAGGLAITALVVGIVAFISGWAPFFGLVVGLVGLVLGIITIVKGRGRGFGITAIILSAIAIITNIVIIALLATLIPWITNQVEDLTYPSDDPYPSIEVPPNGEFEVQTISTPCYTFDGPAGFINNQSAADAAMCMTQLELWGEMAPDGTFTNTGVGAVYGSVGVEAVSAETAALLSPDGTIATMIESLQADYFPSLGTVENLIEPYTLDGVEANLSRIVSDAEFTQTKAVLLAFSPSVYPTGAGDVSFFVVSFVIPDDTGDEVIQAVLDSWRWA